MVPHPNSDFLIFLLKDISDLPENREEILEMTKKLVPEQKRVLKYVVKFCYDMLLAEKNPGFDVDPLRLIIHGGAGKFILNL